MRIRRRLTTAGILLGVVLASSPATIAEEFHDPEQHYALTLPQGWERIAEADLKELNEPDATDESISVIAAFTAPEDGDCPTAKIVVNQMLSEHDGVTDDQLTAELKAQFSGTMRFVVEPANAELKMPAIGEARYDRRRHRLVMRDRTVDEDGEPFHEYVVLQFGKLGMVAVHCMAAENEFAKAMKVFRVVANSFHLDSGFEFAPASGRREFDFGRVLMRAMFGLLVPIILSILAWFKMKKPKKRLPDKLDWSESSL